MFSLCLPAVQADPMVSSGNAVLLGGVMWRVARLPPPALLRGCLPVGGGGAGQRMQAPRG